MAAVLAALAVVAAAQSCSPAAEERAPPAASQPAVTAASLVGRWGDNGDCTQDIVFRSDGAFHSYTGGEEAGFSTATG